MSKTVSYINVYQDFEVLGNTNGYKVQNHAGLGHDGDVYTGGKHGKEAYVIIDARLAKMNGGGASVVFSYKIKTEDFVKSKGKEGVCIGIHNGYIPIPNIKNYNSEKKWTEGDYLCTEKYSWNFATTPQAVRYEDYYKTNKERKDWLPFDISSYPSKNKPQSWFPASKLECKIDGSGNELLKEGNIGIRGQFCIRIAVTKETTRTKIHFPQEMETKRKQEILAKDKTATTIDQLMNNHGTILFEDGYKTLDNVSIPIAKDAGAYLRGKREEIIGLTEYIFPRSNSNVPSTDFYPGVIVVVDNQFRSRRPNKINFSEEERKPLNFITSLPSSNLTTSFDNVIPTERNLNNKRMDFVTKYSQQMKDLAIPSISSVKESTFESGCGVNAGGSLSGIDFNLQAGINTKKVQIFEFKQILYSISLDDTYKKASDFFTSKLDLNAFKSKVGAYPAAIIDTVHYGKIAYIVVSSEDDSALKVSINEMNGTIRGNTSKCKFTAFTIGGPASYANGVYDFSKADDVKTFVSKLRDEMTAGNASAAVPIEFEASYLFNPNEKVKTNIYQYFHKYVDKVKLKITEGNTGVSMNVQVRYLDKKRNMNGVVDYCFQSVTKSLTSDPVIEVSPWAVAFEIKVSIVGAAASNDFNIFIPYIPLEQLKQDEMGDWIFSVNFGGTTIWNAKEAGVNITPTVQGCYKSDAYDIAKGNWREHEYLNKSEDEVLTTYFNWCEREDAEHNVFKKLTAEKAIKISRTR